MHVSRTGSLDRRRCPAQLDHRAFELVERGLRMPDIPAARNTLRVLGYLGRRSGPVRASTLARDLGLPRSSAIQLIAVSIDEGFLVHYPEDRAYGLRGLLSEIGTSSSRTTRIAQLAQPLLA